MDSVADAARAACRAWFTDAPMGVPMSNLAERLAAIDKAVVDDEDSWLHRGCKAASTAGRHRPGRAAQDAL